MILYINGVAVTTIVVTNRIPLTKALLRCLLVSIQVQAGHQTISLNCLSTTMVLSCSRRLSQSTKFKK